MKVSELREICDALARFATVREKTEGVTSRIGVQAGKGRLKFISGDGESGVVVDVMECSERAAFYIDARPLLQGAKVLPAKSEITFEVSEKGLTITTDSGGKLQLLSKGPLSLAGFAKKPKETGSVTRVSGTELNRMAKMFPAATKGDEKLENTYGSIHVLDDGMYFTFVEPRVKTKYASYKKPLGFGTPEETAYVVNGSVFEALRAVKNDSDVILNESISVIDGGTTVYTNSVQNVDTWPLLRVTGELHSFEIDRKSFMGVLKGQVPNDEYARVVLSWDKDSLEVRPYGSEGGQTIPVKTVGHGTRGVSATLMLDMLNGMDDAKVVNVGIAEGAPAIILRAKEYEDWTLMVAPLVLN